MELEEYSFWSAAYDWAYMQMTIRKEKINLEDPNSLIHQLAKEYYERIKGE